ncbi:hypothetical protein [Bradyrhizobium sp. 930_D9_N1_4]|uniref:hypothetical protein n=1 Tax=Bradyrhizobium sp. 930_D9_N1_4 TaxID=3240374 RepID=UPI003F8899AF
MPMSNYPNGFPTGVMIRGVPLAQTHPGKAFWLSNNTTGLLPGQRGGSDGNKGTFDSPFSTLAGAVAQCVAGRGDVIFVKPGHAETISSSTALTMSIAGVAVVGLGTGTSRPKWTIDTANTATINVSAADVSFQNVQVVGNFLSIAAAFTLSTAKNFTLQDVEVRDTSGILNFLNAVKSTGAANTVDGLTAINCYWKGLGTTSVNAFILTANDIDGLVMKNNTIKLARTADAAQVVVTAGVLTNLDCGGNKVYTAQATTANGSLINVGGTTSTGFVYNNYVQTLTTSSDKLFTTTVGLAAFENRVTGVVGATGFVIPAVDS